MNKTFLFVFGMMILVHAAKGQSQYGVKVGVNLANQVKKISIPQVPSITQDTKSFAGYQLGAFYKAKLISLLSVSVEANFSVIGSSREMTSPDGENHLTHEKLGYLELPLTLQCKINKIYFGAGPGLGLKLFSKITNFEGRSYDISNYRAMDASGNLLAGYSITSNIDVNIRYSHGFMNLYEDPGNAEAKNRFFNLSVLYSLK